MTSIAHEEPVDNVPNLSSLTNPTPPAPGASPTPLTDNGTAGAITTLMADQVNNPSLPVGAQLTPVKQAVGAGEDLNDIVISPTQTAAGAQVNAPPKIEATPVTADTVSNAQIEANKAEAMAQSGYDATKIGAENTPQAVAAQGTVGAQSTVKGQLEGLMQGNVREAAWAKGSVIAAEEAMAARGLGASSIAGAAITQAIMDAGIKVADTDAKIYASMDLKNLDNRQQAAIENTKMRHQTMLSDQAAENAAKQFNAQSKTQVATFFANLMAETDKFNVGQANAMKQFNASQGLTADTANAANTLQANMKNAELENVRQQFNAEQGNKMEQFYKQNQLIVDQSNASWRRDINTNNTTAENAANQFNAANTFSLSTTAMNNIWQAARDEADWINTAAENQRGRAHNLAVAALNRSTQFDILDETARNNLYEMLGNFGFDILSEVLDG